MHGPEDLAKTISCPTMQPVTETVPFPTWVHLVMSDSNLDMSGADEREIFETFLFPCFSSTNFVGVFII